MYPDQLAYVIVNILSLLRSVTDFRDIAVVIISVGQRHPALHDRFDQGRGAVGPVPAGIIRIGRVDVRRSGLQPSLRDPVQLILGIDQAPRPVIQRGRFVLRVISEFRRVLRPGCADSLRKLRCQFVRVVVELTGIGVIRACPCHLLPRPARKVVLRLGHRVPDTVFDVADLPLRVVTVSKVVGGLRVELHAGQAVEAVVSVRGLSAVPVGHGLHRAFGVVRCRA